MKLSDAYRKAGDIFPAVAAQYPDNPHVSITRETRNQADEYDAVPSATLDAPPDDTPHFNGATYAAPAFEFDRI